MASARSRSAMAMTTASTRPRRSARYFRAIALGAHDVVRPVRIRPRRRRRPVCQKGFLRAGAQLRSHQVVNFRQHRPGQQPVVGPILVELRAPPRGGDRPCRAGPGSRPYRRRSPRAAHALQQIFGALAQIAATAGEGADALRRAARSWRAAYSATASRTSSAGWPFRSSRRFASAHGSRPGRGRRSSSAYGYHIW